LTISRDVDSNGTEQDAAEYRYHFPAHVRPVPRLRQ
jgi:hypothetical protein